MPKGIIKMFNNEKGFGSSNPTMEVTTFSFMSQRCDEITRDKAVIFEIGADPKTGKTKAVSVDLA
jgi:cold shock CspA family protein